MALEQFMNKFGADTEEDQWHAQQVPEQFKEGALDKFVAKFNGNTESYWFYNNTIELRFQPEEHIYYRVGDLGQLVPQDGVTTICKIIDKSMALVPWSAKMVVEKLLRTIPTITKQEPIVTDPTAKDYVAAGAPTMPVQYIAPMSLEDFTKIALEAKTAPRDKLEEAGDVGHMAHTWLEYFIKAVIAGFVAEQESKLANLPADERARNCVLAALGWMKTHNVRWVATERKVYSCKYSYAGTTDGIALVDSCDDPLCQGCRGEQFKDRLTVIDWKSSNYLYLEYLYQTAAYVFALMEEFGEDMGPLADANGQLIRDSIVKYGPITDRWVLRLGKEDGEFDPWHTTADDFQEDLEGFLDALSLTRSVHLSEERIKTQKTMVKEAKKKAKAEAKEREKEAKKVAKELEKQERRQKKELEKAEKKRAKAEERAALRDGKDTATIVDVSDTVEEEGFTDEELNAVWNVNTAAGYPAGMPVKGVSKPETAPAVVDAPVSFSTLPEEQVIARPAIVLPMEV